MFIYDIPSRSFNWIAFYKMVPWHPNHTESNCITCIHHIRPPRSTQCHPFLRIWILLFLLAILRRKFRNIFSCREPEWIEMDHQDTIINDQTSSNIIKHGKKCKTKCKKTSMSKIYSMLVNVHDLNSKESRKSLLIFLSVWSACSPSSLAYMKQGRQSSAKLSHSHKHKQIHSRM